MRPVSMVAPDARNSQHAWRGMRRDFVCRHDQHWRRREAGNARQIEQLGLRNVLIRAMALTAEQERNARSRGSPGLKFSDGERLKAASAEVHEVAAVRELKVTTLALTREFSPQVLAVTPNFIKVQRLEIDRGRFITDADTWQRNLVCVLGYGVSNALGEAGRPGGVLRIEDALCNVVGVLKRFERNLPRMPPFPCATSTIQ